MTNREVMQQALKCIERLNLRGWILADFEEEVYASIDALKTALAQPEQEPSVWRDMVVVSLVREGINKHKARELADHFTAQRQWQGLTDEEIWSVVSRIGTSDSNVNPLTVLSDARAIEAALKEKNT